MKKSIRIINITMLFVLFALSAVYATFSFGKTDSKYKIGIDGVFGDLPNGQSPEGIIYKYDNDSDSLFVIDYIGTNEVVEIPDTYFDFPVTKIDYKAFENKAIKSLSLGENVTRIEIGAFKGSKIETLTGLENVEYIGGQAFFGTDKLTSPLYFKNVQYIGDNAFSGAYNVSNVYFELEDGMYDTLSIGYNAFSSMGYSLNNTVYVKSNTIVDPTATDATPNLKFVVVDEILGNLAYETDATGITYTVVGHNGLIKDAVVVDQINELPVTRIAANAFNNNQVIENFVFGANVTYVESGAFKNSSIQTMAGFESLVTIESQAFYSMLNLSSDVHLENVQSIGTEAFRYSGNISELRIDLETLALYNALRIQANAFSDLNNTQGRIFLNSVSYVSGVFSNSPGIILRDRGAVSSSYFNFKINEANTGYVVTYYNGNAGTIINIPEIILDMPVVKIDSEVFRGKITSSTTVNLNESMREIGWGAFLGTNTTRINGLENVEIIESGAFKESKINHAIQLNNIQFLGFEAFNRAASIPEVGINLPTQELYDTLVIDSDAFGNLSSANNSKIFVTQNTSVHAKANNGSETKVKFIVADLIIDGVAYKYESETDTYTVLGANRIQNVVIKDNIDGVLVTKIEDAAFQNHKFMQTVTIGANITAVPVNGFQGASALTTVIGTENILSVGNLAFQGATALKTVSGFTNVENVGNGAFQNLTALTSIDIFENLVTIGNDAFRGLTNLQQEIVFKKVQSIGRYAFNSSNKIPSITFDLENSEMLDTLTIGEYAFNSMGNTYGAFYISRSTVLGANNTSTNINWFIFDEIVDDVFYQLNGSEYYVVGAKYDLVEGTIVDTINDLPVTQIAAKAFRMNPTLKSLTLGQNVTLIGDSAFELSAIESFNGFEQLITINQNAFKNANQLTTPLVFNKIQTLGVSAFENATSVPSIEIELENERMYSDLRIGATAFKGMNAVATLNILPASYQATSFENSPNITVTNRYLVDGLAYTYNFLTEEFTVSSRIAGLVNVVIPDTLYDHPVTTIGANAFKSDATVLNVTLGANIVTIGASAFESSKIVTITGLEDVETIGNLAFSGTGSLTSDIVLRKVKTIGQSAFSYATRVTKVAIETEDLVNIGQYAFSNMGNAKGNYYVLRGSTVGSSNTSTNLNWFYYDELVNDVYYELFNGIYRAIGSTYGTSEVIIEDEVNGIPVTAIGPNGFRYNQMIRTVTVGANILVINERAFENSSIETFNGFEQIQSFGLQAFYSAKQLSSPVVLTKAITVGQAAFQYTEKIPSIEINLETEAAYNAITIYAYAFANIPSTTKANLYLHSSSYQSTSFTSSSGFTVRGRTYSSGSMNYAINPSNTEWIFTSYSGSSSSITISNTVYSLPVTSIQTNAVRNNTVLRTVTVGDNMNKIGDGAFENTKITTFVGLNYVEVIGLNAFRNITTLTSSITFNKIQMIGNYAFYGSTAIPSITLELESEEMLDTLIIGENSFGNLPTTYGDIYVTRDTIVGEGNENPNLHIFRYDEVIDGVVYTLNEDETTYLVSGALRGTTTVNIPAEINGLTVTEIKDYAFKLNPSVTAVALGENITTIGVSAFESSKLVSITGLENVVTIKENAFRNITSLTSEIVFNELQMLGNNAFNGSNQIISMVLNLGDDSNLDTLAIGDNALANIGNMYGKFYVNRNTQLGLNNGGLNFNIYVFDEHIDNVYYQLNAEETAYIVLGAHHAATAVEIQSLVNDLPVTSVSTNAFRLNKTIETVVLGSNMQTISANAFELSSVKNVFGLENVSTIKASAFLNATSLETPLVFNKLQLIETRAFEGANKVQSIAFELTHESMYQTLSIATYAFSGMTATGTLRLVTASYVSTSFNSSPNIQLINRYLIDGLTYTFNASTEEFTVSAKQSGLVTVTIPETLYNYPVTTIAANVFKSDTTIKTLNLGSNIKTIGFEAFRDSKIVTFTGLENVVTFEEGALRNITTLTSPVVLNKVQTIGNYAFYNSYAITSLVINLETEEMLDNLVIGNYAFALMSNTYGSLYFTRQTTIGTNNTSTNLNWFVYDLLIDGVYYQLNGSEYTVVGAYTGLTEIEILDEIEGLKVTSIAAYAFRKNPTLVTVTNGANVAEIGDYAFYFSPIVTFNGFEQVVTVGKYAFNNATALTSDLIFNKLQRVKEYAFQYATSVTNIAINLETTAMYDTLYIENVGFGNMPAVRSRLFLKNNTYTTFAKSDSNGLVFSPRYYLTGNVAYQLPADNSYWFVAGYDGSPTTITILDTIYDMPVIRINNSAFKSATALRYVTIGANIKEIGNSAFENTQVISVSGLQNVEIIGNSAFRNMTALTSTLVFNKLQSVGEYAFFGSNKVASITIDLTDVDMYSTLTLGEFAFANMTNTTGSLQLVPNTYGETVFDGSTNIVISPLE
ncbi:leucine-rich repeat protein [Acholeplasma equirhinis]|uniref:leucine-rich repeat protein n=1 Tax=Acholeplasma equirhinis TaxID=555393 RepID=UPI00197AF116|nr:leucine-rich repeat protein [Acholeplasma equirhinis]MBN3490604.1 leucine-rich repeat protein [Acholeplasma equirhinis]